MKNEEARTKLASISSKQGRKYSDMRLDLDNEQSDNPESVRNKWRTEYQTCRKQDSEDSIAQPPKLDFGEAVEVDIDSRDLTEEVAWDEAAGQDRRLLEESSVIIDHSDCRIFEEADKAEFNLDEHLKKMDEKTDLSKIVWESKVHDIYEPEYTTHTPSPAPNFSLEPQHSLPLASRKNYAHKYSFQNQDKKRSGNGLDCFHSEADVLRQVRPADPKSDSGFQHGSPNILKTSSTQDAHPVQPLHSKPKQLVERQQATSKKPKKEASKLVRSRKEIPITENVRVNLKMLSVQKFKSNPKVSTLHAKEPLRSMKKKNSVIIQTRSNSRECVRESNHKEVDLQALKFFKRDRDESPQTHLKKKVRIRDRNEQGKLQKDLTNSVFLKKKKKKPDILAHSLKEDRGPLNKLVEKKMKQKKEANGMSGSLLAKPFVLEQSQLTEEHQSRRFHSDYSRSPKYDILNPKFKLAAEPPLEDPDKKTKNSKPLLTKKTKKSKSVNKKKPADAAASKPLQPFPADKQLRRSQERGASAKPHQPFASKPLKKEDLQAPKTDPLKHSDLRAAHPHFPRPATHSDETAYYSQRSKATHKQKHHKKLEDPKPFASLASGIAKTSGVNSPGKAKPFAKNSSSLLEKA